MLNRKIKHPIDLLNPFILQPLCFTGNKVLPTKSRRKFFLSFGDAIICVFKQYACSPDKDIVLMPNYFCTETLDVISRFLKIVFYKINDDFSINKEDYFEKIKQHKPRVIWNYEFLGRPFTELDRERLKSLCTNETIIIEDAAHFHLYQEEILPINKHHFYIDSIRKHSPFLGSHLINENFDPQENNTENWNFYKLRACFYRIIQNILDFFYYISNSKLFLNWGTKLFLKLNDNIGNYAKSTLGEFISYYGYGMLDLRKIKKHNKNLAMSYSNIFRKLNTPLIKILPDNEIEKSRLTSYYPLFVDKSIIESIEKYFSKHNINANRMWEIESFYIGLNEKMYDSFIVFPMHWLIKEKDIQYTYDVMLNFLREQKLI